MDGDHELCTKDDNQNQYSISNVHFAVDEDDTSDLEQVGYDANMCIESSKDGDPPTDYPGKIQEYPEGFNNGSGVHTYIDEDVDGLDGSLTADDRRRVDLTDVTEQAMEEEPSGQTQLPYEAFQIKEERKTREEEYKDIKKMCVFPALNEGDAKDDELDPGERIKEKRKMSKEENEKFKSPSRKTSSDRSRKTSGDRSRRTSIERFRRASSEQSEESRRLFESSDEDDEDVFPL